MREKEEAGIGLTLAIETGPQHFRTWAGGWRLGHRLVTHARLASNFQLY